MRLRAHIFLVLLSATIPCSAQDVLTPVPTTPPAQNSTMSAYAAQRENALAPAYAAQKNHDYEGAYTLFKKALENYSNDGRAMMLTAEAAQLAGHPEEAVSLYERIIAASNASFNKRNGNRLLPTLIQLYASLGRWPDFDKTRVIARQASLDGDPALPVDHGYIIEDYTDATRRIQVLEFPKPFGRFHTRYRFLTVSQFDPNTHFTPYVDLESDDIDQVSFKQQHPDKAAAGDRAYSLDAYPKPTSQALIKFYDGEPTYETVRADVFGSLPKTPLATKTTGTPATPAPVTAKP